MCGIAGVIQLNNANKIYVEDLKAMTDIIAHRGPDGEGHWISGNGRVGLGHRRLSIIDLSHEADQPMHYLDRYTIVFNGEIYNYLELRDVLLKEGYTFKTKSDTEVLMALYDRDKEKCLQLLDGMFSFVLYDAKENKIFCARDRFGEKPFFYSYESNAYFYFGSEMKCLWAGGINKQINERMLFNYLSYNSIENPHDLSETFYNGCTRLPHAHYITIDLNTNKLTIHKYFDIDWRKINSSIQLSEAKEKLRELFYTSVSRRLRSDVPVGSSLSGGLDSSLVVCVIDELKKSTNMRQDTFSAIFPGFKKDERKYMDYVTAKCNVNPHYVTPDDEGMIADLEKLSWHQEEPYLSASIYVQYRVMQLAKENGVTVLLDGQGADEILAGYHHYYLPYFDELKKTNQKAYSSQLLAYKALHSTNDINGLVQKGLAHHVKSYMPGFVKSIRILKNNYNQFKTPILNNDFFNANKKSIFQDIGLKAEGLNHTLYNSTYMNGLQQLLRYADRNSMAHSREVRLPFLSHELVEFLFTLPAEMKINQGWTKWLMRETFTTLPKEIAWRIDKIGYEPPQKNWLESNKVKDMIHESRKKLMNNNILNKKSMNLNENQMNAWTHLMAGQLI